MFLESLGADASLQNAFQPYAERGLVLARVAMSQRGYYQLFTEHGTFSAEALGALRYRTDDRAGMPVTGDWVAARVVGTAQAIVEALLPRKTLFSRRAAGQREDQQAVAANIDTVFLVCGLDADFNLRRLERYLTLAVEAGTQAVMVLSKADLCADVKARVAKAADVARGSPIVLVTTKTQHGLDGVRAFLGYGRTVALLGSSGTGKSTIINGLLGEERLRTNAVQESDGRGRHTTSRRELIPLPGGGAVIDTPGMRELQLWASAESVECTFDEITEITSSCRFGNCSHSGERGCAVAKAIAEGILNPERWNSYRKLMAEARRHEEATDLLAQAKRKRKTKAMHRAMRAFYRSRK